MKRNIERIENNEISVSKAAKQLNICQKTLYNKIKGVHNKAVGRPRVFSDEEERCFKEHLIFWMRCRVHSRKWIAKCIDNEGRYKKMFP